jgi:AraC-like DNA-binding protein
MSQITDLPAAMSQSTLVTVARIIARALEAEYHIGPIPVLASVGLDPGLLHDGELRLPVTGLSQLWLRCVEITGDEHFGVRIARYISPSDLYGIDLTLYASATLGDAVRRFAEFLKLLTTVTEGHLQHEEDGDWRLSYQLSGPRAPVDAARDFFFYSQIHMFERQSQLPARQFLRRLELVRSLPADPTSWQALGVPVMFAQPQGSLVFRADIWDRPMRGANPHLLAKIEQPILLSLARLGAALPLGALKARMADYLNESLSAEQFAEVLGVSADCLQRSLREQQVSFAQLLNQTRQAQTLQLLAMPDLTLDQISSRVGFRNTSSLIRAFRRWHGVTPLQYRKQSLALSQAGD